MTVENSEIKPESKVELSGYEYTLIKEALSDAFRALTKVTLPELYKVIDQDGEPVENYTIADLEEGKYRRIVDIHSTFNANNAKIEYSGDISHVMLEARRVMYEVQQREFDKGNAISVEDLMKEFNAPKLEKVE